MPGAIDRQIEDHRRDTDPHPRWRLSLDARIAALRAELDALVVEAGSPPAASDTVPEDATTNPGSAGTAATYARGDHQHSYVLPSSLSGIAAMVGVGVAQVDEDGAWTGVQRTAGRVAVWDADGIGGGDDSLSYDGAKLTAPSVLASDQAGTGERMVVAGVDGTQRDVDEVTWDANGLKVTIDTNTWIGYRVKNNGAGTAAAASLSFENDSGVQSYVEAYGSGNTPTMASMSRANAVAFMGAGAPLTRAFYGIDSTVSGSAPVYFIWKTNKEAEFTDAGWTFRQRVKVTEDIGTGQRILSASAADGKHTPVDELVWNATTGLSLIKSISTSYFGFSTQNTSNGAAATATWSVVNNASVAALAEAYSSGNSGSEGGIARANSVGFLGQGASLAAVFIGVHSATNDVPVYFIHKTNREAKYTSAGWTFRQRIAVTADAGTGARMLTAAAADGKHTPVDDVIWTGSMLQVGGSAPSSVLSGESKIGGGVARHGTGVYTGTLSASGQITSTVASGTAPFVVASPTAVANLNASLLLGQTWASPGAIGGTTPNAISCTTLTMTRTADAGTTEAVRGDDTRMTNARTPTAHASSHQSGGGDAIKLDDLATPDDNTDLNVSATRHGLFPKLPSVSDGKTYAIKDGAVAEIVTSGATPVCVEATSNAGQSLTASTTDAQWEDEAEDTHGAWSGTVFTAPVAGVYLITASLDDASGGYVEIELYKNGTIIDKTAVLNEFARISRQLRLAVNDTIRLRSGHDIQRSNSASANFLTITKISG
jgi:hypothetical protein